MTKPVLLLIFRRPDTTAEVMKAIRAYRPSRLYVAGDGPRARVPDDEAACAEARRVALEVDWDCEVRTLLRDENLGLRRSVSGALDWFFETEEEGLVLEDDCVPHPDFFRFCEILLERYRTDERVMAISGDCFQPLDSLPRNTYYFSRYMHCWGWATWRRAWSLYDRDMTSWPQFKREGGLKHWSGGDLRFQEFWEPIFDDCAANRIDSWAYRFLLSCWANSGLTILPAANLVSNVGFGPEATHTNDRNNQQASLPVVGVDFPLQHPSRVSRDASRDAWEHRAHFVPNAYMSQAERTQAWLQSFPTRLNRRMMSILGKKETKP